MAGRSRFELLQSPSLPTPLSADGKGGPPRPRKGISLGRADASFGAHWDEPGPVGSGAAVPAACAGVSPATISGAGRPSGRRDACPTTTPPVFAAVITPA